MFMSNRLLRAWFGRLPTVFTGVSLVLVLVNGILFLANRSTQADVTARGQYITQTVQLDRISQAIVRAAATAAVNDKDQRLGDVLAANGIRYEVAPPGADQANPAPANAATPAPAAKGGATPAARGAK